MDRKAPTKTASDEVERWLDEIKDAKKRESDFRKDGERTMKIYGAGSDVTRRIK